MKKLKGFTLAEVLLTMSVVGIIAALTLPVLTTNVQSANVGPALGRVVSALENAHKLALAENNARHLGTICGEHKLGNFMPANYPKCLGGYTPLDNFQRDYRNIRWYTYDGSKESPFGNSERQGATYTGMWMMNDGAVLWPAAMGDLYVSENGMIGLNKDGEIYTGAGRNLNKYHGAYYNIIVDINGVKPPNREGVDTFRLLVDFSGTVVPYGGEMYRDYMNENNVLYKQDSTSCQKGKDKVKDGFACTGAIADNGWKVNYR